MYGCCFTLKQVIEKRREFNLETHLAFIDYNKAFDSVDRNKLWNRMQQRGYPIHLIQAIQSLYNETKVIIQSGDQITEGIETNQGVKQGCSLSPNLFNIYIDDMIRRWKADIKTGIKLNDRICLNTMLFADDQVILQKSESDLQMSVYKFHKLCSEYNMKISLTKTKTTAFHGKQSVRTEIVIDNYTLEQVTQFKYVGCDVYQYDNDVDVKLQKFQNICGTI
jgi:hypothetical protein